MSEVRRALASIVEAVGANPQQPQELSRRFGLDKTLTWKIARFICDDDMLAAATHLPGRASVRNLVEALVKGGATPERATKVLDAMDRFESIVSTHSGDRETFEVMLGSASGQLARRRGVAARKQLYQGASAIWGVQARVHVSLHFIAPSIEKPEMLDIAVICGFIDFRRLRPDVSWTVARRSTFIRDGTPQPSPNTVPLDERLERDAAPVLERFCSKPVPRLRGVFQPAGEMTRFELEPGPVGNMAAADCILGWMARGVVSRYRREGDETGENIVRLSTPAEVLYHDLYMHKSLGYSGGPAPEVFLYSDLPGGPTYPLDGLEAGLLPIAEEVIGLGETPTGAVTTDIPDYEEMVSLAIGRLGYGANDFHGYRLRLRHPPIPTLALFRYPLAERE